MYDQERIFNAAKGRWIYIFKQICPEWGDVLSIRKGIPIPRMNCPVHKGTSGEAFGPLKHVNLSGAMVCNTCGVTSNGFKTLERYKGLKFGEILQRVDSILKMDELPEPEQEVVGLTEEDLEDQKRLLAKLNYYWQGAIPLKESDQAKLYYENRGLELPTTDDVRFHPAVGFSEEEKDDEGKKRYAYRGKFGAILHIIRNKEMKPVNIHRTYIGDDGFKIPFSGTKRSFQAIPGRELSGGAIHLSKLSGDEISVGEGTETCEAWRQTLGWDTWSVANAGMLRTWTPPTGVKRVNIIEDLDASNGGAEAAEALAERLVEMGISVRRFIPGLPLLPDEKSVDWNDVLLEMGPSGFDWVRNSTW